MIKKSSFSQWIQTGVGERVYRSEDVTSYSHNSCEFSLNKLQKSQETGCYFCAS